MSKQEACRFHDSAVPEVLDSNSTLLVLFSWLEKRKSPRWKHNSAVSGLLLGDRGCPRL